MFLGAIALLPLMTACCDYEDERMEGTPVPVTFYLQTAGGHQTRAYINELAAESAAESAINSVKVWFFDDAENCVA